MDVAIVGTGYVGLVTGVILADLGNRVICVDRDQAKLDLIAQGKSPIYEPGLEEIIKRTLQEGNLLLSSSIEEATKKSEVVFIAVGTPPGEDGSPDLSAVLAVANAIAPAIDKPTVIVNKSTVPVGTAQLVEDLILSYGTDPGLFEVVSNPEFLREGSAVHDTLRPDRVVVGSKTKSAAMKLVELYSVLEAPIVLTTTTSAELIKYASNSFLAVKISFINAISRICEKCGADVEEVARGMGLDKRIGSQFLKAGLGWGGSCFPKDVQGLTKTGEKLGYRFDLLTAADDINKQQTTHFLTRLEEKLGGLSGKRIGLLGLAFKPNTDDIRDAKSFEIIDYLAGKGAEVIAHDPVAMSNMKEVRPYIDYAKDATEVFQGSDAVILVTEWEQYRGLNLDQLGSQMKSRILFDGRRMWTKTNVERYGYSYSTIGLE
ncbi:MAG: UDP-glucose/GDP-mannose dehydrogenase family protein [Fimbriimonadaceae bacterium]|nr:UDP-glucose/GDP-mannose dehydrogenase family protein [Fimbriimonadaceae bacterium]